MEASDQQTRRAAARRLATARAALLLAVAIAVFAGWRAFWFLTDDAFIAFRYVSNQMLGHGLVWNAPPFQPVEGYTSFLWVVLLGLVWRVTGVEPPDAANWLSLAFGYATLYLVVRLVRRMDLPPALDRRREWLLALVLLGTISNRTFLAWLSSGLETALFNFCVTWWVVCGLTQPARRGRWWLLGFALSNALIALTRPDGLLFYAAGLALLALGGGAASSWTARRAASLAPLLVVPAHVVWRRLTYGEWLPNTYYAKHVGAWPESGLRYLASFLLEYGLWVWLLLLLVAIFAGLRRGHLAPGALLREYAGAALTLATVTAHVAYYTLVIGGDHFEYRVYSHLIPLLPVAALWLLARVTTRPRVASGVLAALVLFSWPIPWTHWCETRGLMTRDETKHLIRPIAPLFPPGARTVAGWWDTLQAWLISHHVGMRHQEHKVFYETQARDWPTREEAQRIAWPERPVMVGVTVGVPGWVLSEVAILDVYGLNDRVIARTPLEPGQQRRMAHDRSPPPGYLECFRPNVWMAGGRVQVRSRRSPLTDDDIRACETRRWF